MATGVIGNEVEHRKILRNCKEKCSKISVLGGEEYYLKYIVYKTDR